MDCRKLKPRLVFILPGTDTGGMEHFLLRLLPRFSSIAEVAVIVRSARQGALHDLYVAAASKLHYQPVGYLDPLGMWRLFKLFRGLRPDTVCDLSGIFSGVPLMVARWAGVSHRVTFHRRSSFAFRMSPWRKLYARLSIRLVETMATAILANSQTALRFFHPWLSDHEDAKLSVIRNMIDAAELAPKRSRLLVREELDIPEAAKIVLHVGRLDPAKDHETLLAAMVGVMEDGGDVYCVLAGPRTESLVRHPAVLKSAHASRFRFLGDRHDVPDLLKAVDLFFFPSVTEGMPNALIEAMLVGLPVVTSDIEPIRELVTDEGIATLSPPGDAQSFASAVLATLSDRQEQARRTFKHHAALLTSPEKVWPKLAVKLLPELAEGDCLSNYRGAAQVSSED
jgi:glycosyltransferase involved in cell wall biosynthesis